jgi:hypothetical protein
MTATLVLTSVLLGAACLFLIGAAQGRPGAPLWVAVLLLVLVHLLELSTCRT